MLAAINPMNALGARVGAVIEIKCEVDLIAEPVWWCRALSRCENGRTTEDTEQDNRQEQGAKGKVISFSKRAGSALPFPLSA